mmetsp:Transcript_23576/g.74257  ORF Transcript_23576/g.74257 Transcript_23576/m.74257 type:complete len:233 (-) Transcript_23576:1289-1987(-)
MRGGLRARGELRVGRRHGRLLQLAHVRLCGRSPPREEVGIRAGARPHGVFPLLRALCHQGAVETHGCAALQLRGDGVEHGPQRGVPVQELRIGVHAALVTAAQRLPQLHKLFAAVHVVDVQREEVRTRAVVRGGQGEGAALLQVGRPHHQKLCCRRCFALARVAAQVLGDLRLEVGDGLVELRGVDLLRLLPLLLLLGAVVVVVKEPGVGVKHWPLHGLAVSRHRPRTGKVP